MATGQISFRQRLEYAKLTAAEKLTMLITGLAVAAGAFVLGIIFLFFLTIAIAHWIAPSIGLGWAYALMGCSTLCWWCC